ncbi:MAG: AMP-binding protein [Clostridia bacterium]|nr:AMP-binding protein [Clostridia bacterium]
MNKNYPLYNVVKFYDFKEMMDIAVRDDADKTALKYKSKGTVKEITYKELEEKTDKLGTALSELGFSDCKFAVLSENSHKWIITFITVLKGAGVIVPIDKDLPDTEALNLINMSDAAVLFFSGKKKDFVCENISKMKAIKLFVNMDDHEDGEFYRSFYRLVESGEKSLAKGKRKYLDSSNKRDDLKMLVYTSGTTGTAKGVMLSLRNLTSMVYYGLQTITVDGTGLSVLPYHHTYEAVCDILGSLHKHCTICINESLRAVSENLRLYKPDYILLVPVFVEFFYNAVWKKAEKSGKAETLKNTIKLSNALRKTGIDLRGRFFAKILESFGGNLKMIVTGGAPLREELGEFFDAIGIKLRNGYGITECSPLLSVNRNDYSDYRTVGVVVPCVDIKIYQPDEYGDGEIVAKGDTVMLGYYKNKKATETVLKDGWFHTGDIGHFNKDGRLVITGRKKNLIVLKNGKNVYPEEIEEYLLASDYIAEVVVYGIKDESGQETGLLAEIYPDPDRTKGMTEEEITERLKEEVRSKTADKASYKHISEIRIRDTEFEKTTSKKIKRNYNN